MALTRTVLAIAPQHDQLTTELALLDSLVPELSLAEAEIEKLRTRAIDEELRIAAARRKLQREWRASVADQTAITTNRVQKLEIVQKIAPTPKPDETLLRGHPEYITSLGELTVQEEAIGSIRREVAASTDRAELLRVRVSSRDQIFTDLDKLYKLVFDGPTPDFPEDDVLEWQLARAESHQNRFTELRESHRIMRSHLETALNLARKLDAHYRVAVRCCEDGQHLMASLMSSNESNSVELAGAVGICRYLVGEIESHVRAANDYGKANSGRSDSPTLLSLPPIEVPTGIKNGKLIDYNGVRIESQIPLKDSPIYMQRAADTALRALRELEFVHERASSQALHIRADLAGATSEVRTLKLQLHALRRTIFERIVEENLPKEVPSLSPLTSVESTQPSSPETANPSLGTSGDMVTRTAEAVIPPTSATKAVAPVEPPPEYKRH
ncbi:hypothetical protein BKA62DRAFT_770544 [Auriculariales sp. MPI-PUGE-AT-0066]|nr:hypothetical protein BKA62DRAFT_770544 [Auriculariales sp. MPI-PUGE-AT-0066]